MKVRKAQTTHKAADRVVVEVDHPDGGAFGMIIMDIDGADDYAKILLEEEFERDNGGEIVFNPKGEAMKRPNANWRKLLTFAKRWLVWVAGFDLGGGPFKLVRLPGDRRWAVDREDGSDPSETMTIEGVEVTAEQLLDDVLTLMGSDTIEVEVRVDEKNEEIKFDDKKTKEAGKKKVDKPVNESLFAWVPRKNAQILGQRNQVVKGN